MKKIFTKLFCLGVLSVSTIAAYAGEIGGEFTQNEGTAQPGTTYTISEKGQYYLFTPTTNTIEIQTNASTLGALGAGTMGDMGYNEFFFVQADYDKNVYVGVNQESQTQESTGYKFTFSVDTSKQYLIGWQAQNTEIKGGFTFEIITDVSQTPYNLTTIEPVPGGALDYNEIKQIVMTFDAIPVCESVTVSYTDNQGKPQSFEVAQFAYDNTAGEYWEIIEAAKRMSIRLVNVEGNSKFLQAQANADLTQPFQVIINGLSNEAKLLQLDSSLESNTAMSISEDGTLKLSYFFPGEFTLDNEVWPPSFYGYWKPGNKDGIATLTFNDDLNTSKTPTVSVTMGQHQKGSITAGDNPDPSWNLASSAITVNGNTLTINFTGIEYYKSAGSSYSQVTVMVDGLYKKNGQAFYVDGEAGITKWINYSGTMDETPDEMNVTPTVDPSENTSSTPYKEFPSLTITWPDNVVSLVEDFPGSVTCAFADMTEKDVSSSIEGGALVVNFSEIFTTYVSYSGEMVVTVPFGFVENAQGEVNGEVSFTYYLNIEGEEPPTTISGATATPMIGEAGVTGFYITWGDYDLEINSDNSAEIEIVSNIAGITSPVVGNVSVADNILSVEIISPITQTASFNITIPEAYVYVGEEGALNEEETITVFVTYTGVDSLINVEEGVNTIYNLRGVKVNGNNLSKGIYIINGKKVLVK